MNTVAIVPCFDDRFDFSTGLIAILCKTWVLLGDVLLVMLVVIGVARVFFSSTEESCICILGGEGEEDEEDISMGSCVSSSSVSRGILIYGGYELFFTKYGSRCNLVP